MILFPGKRPLTNIFGVKASHKKPVIFNCNLLFESDRQVVPQMMQTTLSLLRKPGLFLVPHPWLVSLAPFYVQRHYSFKEKCFHPLCSCDSVSEVGAKKNQPMVVHLNSLGCFRYAALSILARTHTHTHPICNMRVTILTYLTGWF